MQGDNWHVPTAALKELIPCVDSFVTVDGFSDRAENAGELAELINELGGRAVPAKLSLLEELENMKHDNTDGLTLVCGSLYLVSAVHEALKKADNGKAQHDCGHPRA